MKTNEVEKYNTTTKHRRPVYKNTLTQILIIVMAHLGQGKRGVELGVADRVGRHMVDHQVGRGRGLGNQQ